MRKAIKRIICRYPYSIVISESSIRFVRCLVEALGVDKQIVDYIKFDQSLFGKNGITSFAEIRLGNYTVPTTSGITAESVEKVFFACAMR